ncbi:Uncharacterised protein [Raoultella ornithinolytica]|nr:Uncharacterised protein [Raoultella ornithinolytica]
MQTGHQPVTRSGAKTGANIHPRGQSIQHDSADQHQTAQHQRLHRRQNGQRGVCRQPQHDHIADRSQTRHLTQRDPQQQYRSPGQNNHRAKIEAKLLTHAKMKKHPTDRHPDWHEQTTRSTRRTEQDRYRAALIDVTFFILPLDDCGPRHHQQKWIDN